MRDSPEDESRDIAILVIDANPERAAILEQGLVEAGYGRVMLIRSLANLGHRIRLLDPEVILIDLENPDRDTLESVCQLSREVCRPIALFVDRSDRTMMTQAIEAGVSSYVVDGLRKERVQPIVELAISRFRAYGKLRRERDEAVAALADRKLIDRAKGLLMKQRGLSEEEAYHAMRKAAMRENRKLVEIARVLIAAFQLDL
ncbi:MAG: ANTAR domain-containing protein [Magnetococcales bacterium]|nr:ANTAR domain-containing protein [Magnetococcales bacterium]